jgi:hypothetical protein
MTTGFGVGLLLAHPFAVLLQFSLSSKIFDLCITL